MMPKRPFRHFKPFKLLSMFFSKPQSFVGLDIGASGIKLIELRQTKRRPQLWTYGSLDEPTQISDCLLNDLNQAAKIKTLAARLKTLAEKTKITNRSVVVSLPATKVFQTVITLPPVDKKALDTVVMAETKKLLPLPFEQMQVVFQPLSDLTVGEHSYKRVLVTAVAKNVVAAYTTLCAEAGLNVVQFESETFSLARVFVGKETATTVIIDIGETDTTVSFVDEGVPMVERSINTGGITITQLISERLGISKDDAGNLKSDVSRLDAKQLPADFFAPLLNELIQETEETMNIFAHQAGHAGKKPEKIVLTGGGAVWPLVGQALRERFACRVFVGDPWARVVYPDSLRPTLGALGPRFAVAIGLALHNF